MDISEQVAELLQNKDYDSCVSLVFNLDNQLQVSAYGMDLITRICEYGIASCACQDSLVACQDMLMHVVRQHGPKGSLISLLEQAEMFVHRPSSKFSSLLPPLQHVMLHMPEKREHTFSWVLSILNSHIKSQHKFPKKLKIARDSFRSPREAQLILEQNPKIQETILIYNQYCNFYDPLVCQFWNQRVALLSSTDPDKNALSSIRRQQDILRDHLVQLLGDPLLHFDLHLEKLLPPSSKVAGSKILEKSDARLVTERIMAFLHLADQYPTYYMEWSNRKLFLEQAGSLKNKLIYCGGEEDNQSDDGDSDECVVDFSSVVNYYYLIYVEGLNRDLVPSVFNPSYVFLSCVRLMCPILSGGGAGGEEGSKGGGGANRATGPVSLFKCFLLAQKLLDDIDWDTRDLRLNSHLLQTGDISDFIESVAYHTVYSEDKLVRREGLQVLRKLMWKFEPKGIYDFVLFVANRIQNDGVKGYVITQLKDCIRLSLDDKQEGNKKNNGEMGEYFTGKSLVKILRQTCYLKDGVTTDLMDNKEQIISALNLFLYLAIREKGGNGVGMSVSGVGEYWEEIKRKMLEPLFKGLEYSRAHYKLKLKELTDPQARQQQRKELEQMKDKLEVMVKNDKGKETSDFPPEVPIEQQKKAVEMALSVFDVMNVVLGNVNEFVDGHGKKNNENK